MSDNKEQKQDLLITGPQLDEKHKAAIRISENRISVGTIAPMSEGIHPNAELIQTQPVGGEGSPVSVIVASSKHGPAMVNSEDFRRGWTNIFGEREVGRA